MKRVARSQASVVSSKRLQKQEIIRGRGAFSRIISEGQRIQQTHLRGYLLAVDAKFNRGRQFRIGFAVSRQVKSAVARNRIRRLMREAYQRTKETFAKPTRDNGKFSSLVVLYIGNESTGAKKVKLENLEEDLQKIFQEAFPSQ